MQKLDYTENISVIIKSLNTEYFVDVYNTGIKKPSTPHDFSSIIPSLFDSKSQFEIIVKDKDIHSILKTLGADAIYSSTSLTWFTTVLTGKNVALAHLLSDPIPASFFMLHKTLYSVSHLNKAIFDLQKGKNSKGPDGKIVFRIIEEHKEISIENYSKIFRLLDELLSELSKFYGEKKHSQVYLLDSGSDTNLGIETGIKVAKSVYLIFKEIWDSVINRKYYKQSKNNQAIIESLTLRTEIREKREAGIITEKEEVEYVHYVKSRVDELINLNVITKEIYDSNESKKTMQILLSAYSAKLLKGDNLREQD